MAPVYRRSRPPPIQTENLTFDNDGALPRRKSPSPVLQTVLAFVVFAAVIAFAAQHAAPDSAHSFRNESNFSLNKHSGSEFRTELAPGVTLSLDLRRLSEDHSKDNALTFGPHTIGVFVQRQEECKYPRVWVRLVGDALISVPIEPLDGLIWKGTFSFPVEGTYRVEVKWTHCDNLFSYTTPMNLTVTGTTGNTSILRHSKSSEPIFQQGLWLSSQKFKAEGSTQPYIWHVSRVSALDATLLKASSSRGESLVSKEGTRIPDEFQDLSNYELVCWVGSQSAASIREAFLSVRPELFPHQRPFKFHYYNVTSFEKPDQHWDQETKKRFRKCKTVLVSVDELEEASLTQAEYKRQVKTFLSHIVKAIDDDTFPVWMTTANEPPMTASPMCTWPAVPSSSNHPCNDALADLWKENAFPPRIKLLDTTHLVDPQFGENQKDIIAVIAMRIYALVGHQVAEWRRANQIGKVNGLIRNGKVEQNPKEVPYDWSTAL